MTVYHSQILIISVEKVYKNILWAKNSNQDFLQINSQLLIAIVFISSYEPS